MYTRRYTRDGVTVMNRELYDNLQDGIDETRESITGFFRNGTLVSENADFAEVGLWYDENPNGEERTCYFVSISETEDGITMKKATSTSDVRGVTIANPAFSANATKEKYDSDGVLKKEYSYVAFAGFATVIDNGSCKIKDRCIPDDNGCAIPSDNNMGYQVISRVNENKILVLIEPNADTLYRIRKELANIEERPSGLTEISYTEWLKLSEQERVEIGDVIVTDYPIDEESFSGIIEMDYSEWELLTDEQKRDIEDVIVVNYPINESKGKLNEIDYSEWSLLSEEEKKNLGDVIVLNHPVDFTLSDVKELIDEIPKIQVMHYTALNKNIGTGSPKGGYYGTLVTLKELGLSGKTIISIVVEGWSGAPCPFSLVLNTDRTEIIATTSVLSTIDRIGMCITYI